MLVEDVSMFTTDSTNSMSGTGPVGGVVHQFSPGIFRLPCTAHVLNLMWIAFRKMICGVRMTGHARFDVSNPHLLSLIVGVFSLADGEWPQYKTWLKEVGGLDAQRFLNDIETRYGSIYCAAVLCPHVCNSRASYCILYSYCIFHNVAAKSHIIALQ